MAHMDISWTELFAHRQINRQICEFNVMVSESDGIVAELTPGDFQVLGSWVDNCSSSVSLSFADLRSMRVYDLCEQQVLNSQPHMCPDTVRFLVDRIVERGMELVSQHGEDDVNFGYVIDARVDVENFRVADEEDLAICKQFDDMEEEEEGGIEDYDGDENEDDIEGVDNDNDDDGIEDYDSSENEDDIEGVEIDEDDDMDMYEDDDMDMYEDDEANPRFRGVEEGKYDGKEVITCSVCLEDLSSGMEFNKLPCSHTFHSSCIDHWLTRNRSCPNCRAELTKLEERGQCVIA